MDNTNNTTWMVVGLGILIIIFGGWWISTHNASTPTSSSESAASSTAQESATSAGSSSGGGVVVTDVTPTQQAVASPTTSASGETISVADQPAGESVTIASATLVKPSWIAIKDVNGWILGARRFDSSVTNGEVSLLRATKPGINYYAVIFIDDGDGIFDFHKDSIVVDSGGEAVNRAFLAQ